MVSPNFSTFDRPISQESGQYLLAKRKKRTHNNVCNIKKALSGIMKSVFEDKIIDENVAHGIVTPKGQGEQSKEMPRALNEQRVEILLKRFIGHCHHELLLFLARVGCLTTGEAAGLKWSDLSLDMSKVTIRQAIVQGEVTSTKTGKERTVDLTPQVVAALRKLKLRNQKRRPWVFQNSRGNYVDMDNFRQRDFRPALAEFGLQFIRVHDLRHYC